MSMFLRGERPPRPGIPRGHPLAGLRVADPEWQPAWCRGPVDPEWDPCGRPAPPFQAPGRRKSAATLIAAMGRYAR